MWLAEQNRDREGVEGQVLDTPDSRFLTGAVRIIHRLTCDRTPAVIQTRG